MDSGLFHHLRIISAAEVASKSPSVAYSVRQIFRWYSKTFHTPLHLVAEIPLYDVIQAYYESHYEGLDEEDLHKEIHELALTQEERLQKAFLEDAEDFSLAQLEKQLADEAKQAEAPKTVEAIAQSKAEQKPIELPEIKMSFLELDDSPELMDKDPLDFAYDESSKITT